MIQVAILEDEDTILGTDFVRQLKLEYVGQSDVLLLENNYSRKPINYLTWLEVSRAGMDYWVGRTVGEFRSGMLAMEKQHQPVSDYEFIRGEIPKSHIMPETGLEKYHRVHKHFRLPHGKYKGELATHVKHINFEYYQWAVDAGLVPYEVWQSLNNYD